MQAAVPSPNTRSAPCDLSEGKSLREDQLKSLCLLDPLRRFLGARKAYSSERKASPFRGNHRACLSPRGPRWAGRRSPFCVLPKAGWLPTRCFSRNRTDTSRVCLCHRLVRLFLHSPDELNTERGGLARDVAPERGKLGFLGGGPGRAALGPTRGHTLLASLASSLRAEPRSEQPGLV